MLISNSYSGFDKGNLNQNYCCTQISRSVSERVFATTPSTSSRFPASLVRFASSRSRTPAVLLFNDCRACDVFFPRKHPPGFPSMSHGLIRLQPESLSLSGPPSMRSYPSGSIPAGSILFLVDAAPARRSIRLSLPPVGW
jgi:hypothetical protein